MTLITLPGRLYAGDDHLIDWTDPDYPAPEWRLYLALFSAAAAYHVESDPLGTAHRLDLTSALTATWTPSRYDWTAYVATPDGIRRRVIATGLIRIQDDPSAPGPRDARTHARRMLDAIEATLEGRATRAQLDMIQARIGAADREISLKPELLIPWRDRYRAEVAAEERATGTGGHMLKVRF